MKSIRIYQSGLFDKDDIVQLDKFSSNHLIKVLRLKNNYIFTLFNGEGTEYSARLEVSGKKAIAHIESSTVIDNESNINIHLFQGISKGDRMDFAIQKSIELGVTQITPVITERTVVNLKGEREQKKLDHWRSIAISACEQSGRNYLPAINPVGKLETIFNDSSADSRLLLDPLSSNNLQSLSAATNIHLLIGPEGGLSESEIIAAKNNGFEGIKLGPRILRTETAALAAITSVQLLWGDLGR
ncbi:MAG: 16S rRNA (uracil(1498)-N(3))-methyltransferase [endosymbiont of Galathealinum brachiosum]|uniref:Ribosomal RNA small subunit methyltransferase E n=1 Tax=endosymbiont of Galathealinum brachiosum TaxID=2200906 RepID=A0A370DDB7_9GAMM|nr:MAG: 16S rRNA (uracil(1498)-N(3))-methyltransferase [endosymbiont of Galathealinum brachiosum]